MAQASLASAESIVHLILVRISNLGIIIRNICLVYDQPNRTPDDAGWLFGLSIKRLLERLTELPVWPGPLHSLLSLLETTRFPIRGSMQQYLRGCSEELFVRHIM